MKFLLKYGKRTGRGKVTGHTVVEYGPPTSNIPASTLGDITGNIVSDNATITGGTLDGVPIGSEHPAAGFFTQVNADTYTGLGELATQDLADLGLGTAAACDVGAVAGNLVVLDSSGTFPSSVIPAATEATFTLPHGCRLSNAADADYDITISAGFRVSESDYQSGLSLASAITKRLDGIWVAGSGSGGRYGSSLMVNTTYHVYLIGKTDGTMDAMFSTGASSPPLPAGYPLYCRLGAVITDASGNILPFTQMGPKGFLLKTPVMDLNSSTIGPTATLVPLSVPTGLNVMAWITSILRQNSGRQVLISAPSTVDLAPSRLAVPGTSLISTTFYDHVQVMEAHTNTSGQVRVRGNATSCYLNIYTKGWTDFNLQALC